MQCLARFLTVEVELTKMIVEDLAAAGIEPYWILTTVTRCACDFNRPEETAFENVAVAPYYHHYHRTIEKYVEECTGGDATEYVLLLDIHGQSEPGYKDKILRGTQNGKTLPV